LKQNEIEKEKLKQEKQNLKERIDKFIVEYNDKISKEKEEIHFEFEIQIKNLSNQVLSLLNILLKMF
jgi:cell division GTPase FtsZ